MSGELGNIGASAPKVEPSCGLSKKAVKQQEQTTENKSLSNTEDHYIKDNSNTKKSSAKSIVSSITNSIFSGLKPFWNFNLNEKSNEPTYCDLKVARYLVAVVKIFNPFITLIQELPAIDGTNLKAKFNNLIDEIQKGLTSQEEVKKEFPDVLKTQLADLKSVVAGLKNISDQDLARIIRAWRQHEHTDELFKIATKIQEDGCLNIREEAREKLAHSINELAEFIKHAESLPDSEAKERYIQSLKDMAHKHVDAVEHLNEGNDGNGGVTKTAVEKASEALDDAAKIGEKMANNPTLKDVLHPEFREYISWLKDFITFFEKWFRDIERDREEKIAKEKACEKRKAQKQKIKKLIRVEKYHRKKIEEYLYAKEIAQRKYIDFLRMLDRLKQSGINSLNTQREISKLYGKLHEAKLKSADHAYMNYKYKTKKEKIYAGLGPSYICEIPPYNLELDLIIY